eukprot:scaffold861_cov123-Isochrysis_galbana.AAC.5
MFATVHTAGSSLLGLFTSCTTFDSTSGSASSAYGIVRRVTLSVAQAGNRTCIEESSARSTRTLFWPFSAAMSTSSSSSRSCRGAIAALHALAEFFFSSDVANLGTLHYLPSPPSNRANKRKKPSPPLAIVPLVATVA